MLCLNFGIANANNPCDCADFDPGQCGADNANIVECQGGTCEECNQAILKAIQANSVPIDNNLWVLAAIGAIMAIYYHNKK